MDTGKVKQVIKVLGYYKTKDEATVALSEYLHTPYDIDTSKYTFKDVYERWFDLNIADKDSNYRRTITAAYAYCHYLYNIRFKDIRVYPLKDCISYLSTA